MKLYLRGLFVLIVLTYTSISQDVPRYVDSRDFALMLTAECTKTPSPKIKLTWEKNELAIQYFVYRKLIYQTVYPDQPLAILDSLTFTFTDTDVNIGETYDYEVRAFSYGSLSSGGVQTPFNFIAYGYSSSGIEIPDIENYGWILILVDETMLGANGIDNEINTLKEDLRGEGWGVIIKSVPRAGDFDGQKVMNIKKIIKAEYESHQNDIRSLLLLGRVPVPYSGDLNPDAHPDHKGAWPADVYYTYIGNDFIWTDNQVNRVVSGQREANKNIPGDLKFDQTGFQDQFANFGVGRVDFYNMASFYDTTKVNPEMELVRNYLNKNHKYRTGGFDYKWQGLVDDNFAASGILEAFASSGWRNIGSLLGPGKTMKSDFIESLSNDSYLWAYGCGGGSYQSAGGIGNSEQISKSNLNGIYTMLFGSYFGDWDSPNNFLRAPLATNPSVLTCAWAGRPHWYFHQMGVNLPIGESALLSHNNLVTYKPNTVFTSQYPNGVIYAVGMKNIHTALMGDPSLRMYSYSVPQAQNLIAIFDGKYQVNLKWENPLNIDPQLAQFNVYRSTDKYGLYTKINDKPISGTEYEDTYQHDGEVFYCVKTVLLETSNTATFYNTSRGIFASTTLSDVDGSDYIKLMSFYPNPASRNVQIDLKIDKSDYYTLDIYDLLGNKIRNIINEYLYAGNFSFDYLLNDNNGNQISKGTYIMRLKSSHDNQVLKLIVSE